MGAGESSQKLGERVIAARNKLDNDTLMQSERADKLRNSSTSTMKFILDRMQASFKTFSPFLERTLLIAWSVDKEECKDFMLSACKKVLSAPINESEYEWFNKYVLPSTVWMFETKQGRYMYQELMDIVQRQSADIVDNMDSVYAHLQTHTKWSDLMAIQNRSDIDRQDHENVGLLKDAGIQSVADEKDEEVRSFVDSHVAITALTVTANTIDKEFQEYIGTVMGHYGSYKAGPLKKVERCLSKLENDYHDAAYPKSAKLLDIIRCSVTFNTLEQLLVGYRELMSHMDRSSSNIKMARVKNGFLDKTYDEGYRDIKVNVVFQSPINPEIKMICEVQLILSQYLNEKKKIHKLYSIAREETYFDMVVRKEVENDGGAPKDVTQLQFKEALNVGKEMTLSKSQPKLYKCSVDPDLQLLAIEASRWCCVVDMKQKKEIFAQSKSGLDGEHASHWISINGQKYLSVQLGPNALNMYKVVPENGSYKLVDDETYKISTDGRIVYCDFDRDFKNVVMVMDGNALQMRALDDVKKIKKQIALDKKVESMVFRSMQLSANGRLCVLTGGHGQPHFYMVDFESGKQQKFTSSFLTDSNAPCFLNGDTEFVAVADHHGRVEIWDVANKQPVKSFETDQKKVITSSACTHNVFAIGSFDQTLRLYDVKTWKCFYTKEFNCKAYSLHLTKDLKYVTFAGQDGDKCVVLEIE